jgi:hypothetical protein
VLAVSGSPIGHRMICREPRGAQNPAGRITAHDKLLLRLGRSGRSRIERRCKPLSGITKSQFFAATADRSRGCGAVTRRVKEKCAASVCCKRLSGIKKSRFSGDRRSVRDWGAGKWSESLRKKEKCVATPEEHFGNALVALPEPLAYNHSPRTLRLPQKVQRMTRSQSERLMRWEGAVNGRSDVCGTVEALRPRLPFVDTLPSSPTARRGSRLLSGFSSTGFLFATADR